MVLAATVWPVPVAGRPADANAPVHVIAWVDGDTVDVVRDGRRVRVRLIGIAAPETAAGARAAAQGRKVGLDAGTIIFLGHLARDAAAYFAPPGVAVRLEFDVRVRDGDGRLLAYVWRGGRMINEKMLREGFALVDTAPPNVRHTERFLAAQQEARTARRGLWGW
jgi:micrococcal nuclease